MRHKRPSVLTTGGVPGVTLWGNDGAKPHVLKSTETKVSCMCWCERVKLKVPLSLVREGVTESCGREGCEAD